jgi:hypothetical protein
MNAHPKDSRHDLVFDRLRLDLQSIRDFGNGQVFFHRMNVCRQETS